MKRNVFDWICRTIKDATSAVVLTHNIDFLFLQAIVQPRLRKCGNPKLTVFADAVCAAGSYQKQRFVLNGLGRNYRAVRVEMGAGRRFHPKAIFLASPSKAALAVGSGNVTHGGWSANREIWATYESDDGGLPAISAFRDYLRTVLRIVPQSRSIAEEALSPFDDPANSWAAELPEPAGLYGTPSDRPLLDRIIDLIGGDIQQVTVCAPYFDPAGEALAELARRIPAPVTTLLQRNRVGLSATAAANLPANVELSSIDSESSRFIHAKLYGFRRSESTLLIAGSANMSKAAWMATGTWGNAELVAVQETDQDAFDELLADMIFPDAAPELPAIPPSDEWEMSSPIVRILTARFANRRITIVFKSDESVKPVSVVLDDSTNMTCSGYLRGETLRIPMDRCPQSVRLHCVLNNGQEASSEFVWVDCEESLSVSVPERRIAEKLKEAAESGSLSASTMFEILELLQQHLQQPVKHAVHSSATGREDSPSAGRSYRAEDVFSDNFGRPKGDSVAALDRGSNESDFLGAFSAYFSLTSVAESASKDENPKVFQVRDRSGDEIEPEEDTDEKAKRELQQRQGERKHERENPRLRKKLLSALSKVVTAMSTDEFITSRSPERLGADIAATALLLRKGLLDKIIRENDFAAVTEQLWSILFFGSKGAPSAIQKYLDSAPMETKASFELAIASPRLTAALTLWCFPDLGRDSTNAVKFRLAAMVLAAKLPWLIEGGLDVGITRERQEEIIGELRRLSRAMSKGVEFESLLSAWKNWVQAGVAFREFERAANVWTPKDLALLVTDRRKHSEAGAQGAG